MSIQSLGYLGIHVKDLPAWHAFATNVLGLMSPEAANGVHRYRIDDFAWRISAEEGQSDDLAFVGFEVAGASELEALHARLAESGVSVVRGGSELESERGVLGVLSCKDPDGLSVEIFYGPTQRTERPFVSPAGVTGFVTGEQGLGHAVLATKDMAASRHFYQDLLGFRLSDIIRMQMSPRFSFDMEFFHCNPRHHTLALMPIQAPKRLHHFMLQVPTLDAVGFALERAQAAASPIAATLGRHTNDHMVSFYVRTPAGFEVEFGTGAIEVDEATWRVTRHEKPSSWGHKRPTH